MKNKIKKSPEKQTPYCKNCQFYIDYSNEIISISGKESEDGRDICGHSISAEKNYIGYDSFITQGDLVYCDECGTILQDDRQPIYRKCKSKNRKKNCKDFLLITKWQLLKKKLKGIIINIKNMINTFNLTKNYILLFWLIFNIIFLVHNDMFVQMDIKKIFYYSLITLIAFGVSMRK